MITSIGKFSKSFFLKLLVGIIILPFVFWGMGDVFRGGNQNVVATVDSKKISSQDFVTYLNRLNLNEEQVKSLPTTNLINQILAEYIGRKVMALEIEKMNITVNDNSLRNILKNDKLFSKNDTFSRTEYEKFLLKSGITAPTFESNIVKQETRRQYLSSISGGLTVPKILVKNSFNKENQIKLISYVDLQNYNQLKEVPKPKLQEIYEKNKSFFTQIYKLIEYAEITPQAIIGESEFSESFFKQLDILENNILDGQTYEDALKENNLKNILINKINNNGFDENNKKVNLPKDLFKRINTIKNEKMPEVINIQDKYFLAQVKSVETMQKNIDDPEVIKSLKEQFNFKKRIEDNSSLLKDISLGGFDKKQLIKFASENKLSVKNYKLTSLKQNDVFSEGIIKQIYLIEDNETKLITNSTLSKNYLIFSERTDYKNLKENSNEYEKYEAKARLDLVNKIYKVFDDRLNQKYEVEINQRTINRIKNSF